LKLPTTQSHKATFGFAKSFIFAASNAFAMSYGAPSLSFAASHQFKETRPLAVSSEFQSSDGFDTSHMIDGSTTYAESSLLPASRLIDESRYLIPSNSLIGSNKYGLTTLLKVSSSFNISNTVISSVAFAGSVSVQSLNLLTSDDFEATISLIGSKKYEFTPLLKLSSSYENSDSLRSSVGLAVSVSYESITLSTSDDFEATIGLIWSTKHGGTSILTGSPGFKKSNPLRSSVGLATSGSYQSATLLTSRDFEATIALTESLKYGLTPLRSSIAFAASGSVESVTLLTSDDFEATIALIGSTKHERTPLLELSSSYENSNLLRSSLGLAASGSVESPTLLTSDDFEVTMGLVGSKKHEGTTVVQVSLSYENSNSVRSSVGLAVSGSVESPTFLTSDDFEVTMGLVGSKKHRGTPLLELSSSYENSDALGSSVGLAVSGSDESVTLLTSHDVEATLAHGESNKHGLTPLLGITASFVDSKGHSVSESFESVALLVSNNHATTVTLPISSQFYVSTLLDLTDRLIVSCQIVESASVISSDIAKSRELIRSERIDGSVKFVISEEVDQTAKLGVSVGLKVTGVLISGVLYPSVTLIGSELLKQTGGHGLSERFVETELVVSRAIGYSDVLVISGAEIGTWEFEPTTSANITGILAGTTDVKFVGTKNFAVTEQNAAAQLSNGFVITAVLINTAGLQATHGFVNSDKIDGSRSIEGSANFTTSEYFVTQDGGNQGDDRDGISTKALSFIAIGAAVSVLLFAVLVIVFLVKRHKREDLTDLGLDYETEAQANVINLQECESDDGHDGEWDIHDFERALESEFDQPTQEGCSFSDQIFPSDCDELF
jgi:hypothetical protein